MSTTNDSEDWLDVAIEAALPKALRVVYSSNLKRKLLKDAVLAHYAHYLKPEDVETRVKSAEDNVIEKAHKPCECGNDHFGTPVRSVTGVVTTYCQFSRVQPSKLNREEEKE